MIPTLSTVVVVLVLVLVPAVVPAVVPYCAPQTHFFEEDLPLVFSEFQKAPLLSFCLSHLDEHWHRRKICEPSGACATRSSDLGSPIF